MQDSIRPLLFTGRPNRENCAPPKFDKGAQYLLDAMPAILRRNPAARAMIVGDGPQRPLLEARARAAGVMNRVTFRGEVNDRQVLLGHLQAASAFVLPSVADVFPLALLEAMSVGLPVVATNVGGIPECIDETCGMLVEPAGSDLLADAVNATLENDDLRVPLGREARVRAVDRCDWKVAAAVILEAFAKIA